MSVIGTNRILTKLLDKILRTKKNTYIYKYGIIIRACKRSEVGLKAWSIVLVKKVFCLIGKPTCLSFLIPKLCKYFI